MSLTLPLVETLGGPEPEVDKFTAEIEEKSPAGVQGTLVDVPPQPFGRLVTNRMSAAAQHAQSLAEEVGAGDQQLSAFGQLHPEAPNATELEALSGLGGPERNPYQVRFAQSPLAGQRLSQTTLRITPGQQRIMADAAEYLRTKQSRPNVTVEGLVVNLSRDRVNAPGQVIIQGIVDDSGKARRFHVELTPDDYNEALRAHADGLQVLVRGDLDTRGTWKWIRHPRTFAIVPGLNYDED